MSDFQTVAKVGDIPDGEGRSFQVEGTLIALFNRSGQYSAIHDSCPHMGASLATGYLEGSQVTCPWHAWRFSVEDGTWLDNPSSKLNVPCYEVRVQGDDIQIRLPDKPDEPSGDDAVE